MDCHKCTYDWAPRKATPKECPRCKTRLDYTTGIGTVAVETVTNTVPETPKIETGVN